MGNAQPVSYLQTDARWKNVSYSAKGEYTTIGASGCGPTAMAMVLATWSDKSVNPKTECAWALAHGYKAPHSGTYYGYFVPAGARYGLKVTQLNWSNIYGLNSSPHHATAKAAVDRGDMVIACMGKGNWTSSGHYVLVWKIDGNVIYINDPNSTKKSRTQGDYSLFKKQVKYYWVIERPESMKEDDDMDINKMLNEMTDEQAAKLVEKANRHIAKQPEQPWSKDEGWWSKATKTGTVDGSNPEGTMKRCEVISVMGRLGLL